MSIPRPAPVILLAAACLAPVGSLRGQVAPRKVAGELAELLTRAQDDLRQGRASQAAARLLGYRGADHALRHLLLGHAHVQQADLQAAIDAYRQALRMEPGLKEAGLALAQVFGRQEKWTEAAKLLGRFIAADSCDADTLVLYAQVARRRKDARLCELLVDLGIRRFPADPRLRRLDLAACLDRGDHRSAGRAVQALLKETPADPELWQQLAFAHDRTGSEADTLAALEAGLLCDPNDVAKHRRFLGALLAAGDWPTAIERGRALLAGPMAKAAVADAALMEALIRAADMGEQDRIGGTWLALVPDERRTRSVRILAARRALRLGEVADARAALHRLIAQGQADAGVFLWAGHLAEKAKDWPEAETLYEHARKREEPSAGLATLYLARLHLHRGRLDQAARLLRKHLDAHPEDSSARALLAVVDAARAKAKRDK